MTIIDYTTPECNPSEPNNDDWYKVVDLSDSEFQYPDYFEDGFLKYHTEINGLLGLKEATHTFASLYHCYPVIQNGGRIYETNKDIAKELKITACTFKRHKKKLTQAGLIYSEDRATYGTCPISLTPEGLRYYRGFKSNDRIFSNGFLAVPLKWLRIYPDMSYQYRCVWALLLFRCRIKTGKPSYCTDTTKEMSRFLHFNEKIVRLTIRSLLKNDRIVEGKKAQGTRSFWIPDYKPQISLKESIKAKKIESLEQSNITAPKRKPFKDRPAKATKKSNGRTKPQINRELNEHYRAKWLEVRDKEPSFMKHVKELSQGRSIYELCDDSMEKAKAYIDFSIKNWEQITKTFGIHGANPVPSALAQAWIHNQIKQAQEEGFKKVRQSGKEAEVRAYTHRGMNTNWSKVTDGWGD
ncbi:MAG: hypothetical protein COA78_05655 [Blastopirellula sp.]|nr:MAG: hypothetical protein COA78_05655 [Blastopirellula sp.]